jgi:erythromycin esterase-like protein
MALRAVVLGVVVILAGTTTTLKGQAPEGESRGMVTAMDRAVRDLCDKRVALLTEPSTHGFGKTMAFKAALVRRLVEECHYDAFLIESGIYDFINIDQRLSAHKTVSDSMIAAAIGGLWDNEDVHTLIPFLLDNARRGRLTLGGIDDQVGRGSWAQANLPRELVRGLSPSDSERCFVALQRHLLWQYTDQTPFDASAKATIIGCLHQIVAARSRDGGPGRDDATMAESLSRSFAHEFPDSIPGGADAKTYSFNARDRAMLLNFEWWLGRLSAHSKVIVWTATVHGAKNLSRVQGYEQFAPMGPAIHQRFGRDAFVLAFSARAGSYRFARQPERTLTVAGDTTLEGKVFLAEDADVHYLGGTELRRLGTIAARPLGPDFKAANWSDVIDGLVVFREERPPRLR